MPGCAVPGAGRQRHGLAVAHTPPGLPSRHVPSPRQITVIPKQSARGARRGLAWLCAAGRGRAGGLSTWGVRVRPARAALAQPSAAPRGRVCRARLVSVTATTTDRAPSSRRTRPAPPHTPCRLLDAKFQRVRNNAAPREREQEHEARNKMSPPGQTTAEAEAPTRPNRPRSTP